MILNLDNTLLQHAVQTAVCTIQLIFTSSDDLEKSFVFFDILRPCSYLLVKHLNGLKSCFLDI